MSMQPITAAELIVTDATALISSVLAAPVPALSTVSVAHIAAPVLTSSGPAPVSTLTRNARRQQAALAAAAAATASASTSASASASSKALTHGTSKAAQSRAARTSQIRQGRRTRLSSEEKAKVLEVRRQRACLRCKMLKIQCSKENPCKPCLSSAVRRYERKVLSFCYCVRTRFVDMDIFHSAQLGASASVPASVRALLDKIEPPPPLALENDADLFEDTLIRWLTNADYVLPDGSVVATLCNIVGSSESLRDAVDAELTSDFRTFLFATSLAHSGWNGPISHRDLCVAGHLCGSRIVRRLDRILTPQFLAQRGKDTHRALLLLVFGMILGVGYSTRLTTSPSFPHDMLGPEIRHSPTLWMAMKEHLAQMLAHHLIFLGSILGIKLDTAAEKTIIDAAVNRWNKPEHNMWGAILNDAMPPRGHRPKASSTMAVVSSAGTGASATVDVAGVTDLDDFGEINGFMQARSSVSALPPAATTDSSPASSPPPMPMVALSCPDLSVLPQIRYEPEMPMQESYTTASHHLEPYQYENPTSYFDITDEEIKDLSSYPPPSYDDEPPLPSDLLDVDTRPGLTKRRTVWVVRPFDAAGTREPVNVYAEFRMQPGQNIGLFV